MSDTRLTYLLVPYLRKISPALLLVAGISAAYVYFMRWVDHDQPWVPYLVVVLAIVKTVYFSLFTFRQVNKFIGQCRSFSQLLSVFGVLVVLIIFSFAADYTCLNAADPQAFHGLDKSAGAGYLQNLFELFYFSVVTFASIGYGDIAPISTPAKIVSMTEIGQSFVMVIFGLSNINKIHIKSKKQNT
ncbi:MAG: potassium channel family protein [Owenweeksia sp.]|nr:potassium channel family protein [Owenweeksia sp.]